MWFKYGKFNPDYANFFVLFYTKIQWRLCRKQIRYNNPTPSEIFLVFKRKKLHYSFLPDINVSLVLRIHQGERIIGFFF
jgi:hypothetical protein